jgi:hypothetical protein
MEEDGRTPGDDACRMVCSGLSRGKIGKVLELMRSLRVNVALLTRNQERMEDV